MKTSMQELIQSLKAEQMTASNEWQNGYQKALSNIIDEAESLLEKEKEVAQQYAEFAIQCERKELPVLEFDGWINL
jgi:polyhydroxyalkanoate synthesis regulator phasin